MVFNLSSVLTWKLVQLDGDYELKRNLGFAFIYKTEQP